MGRCGPRVATALRGRGREPWSVTGALEARGQGRWPVGSGDPAVDGEGGHGAAPLRATVGRSPRQSSLPAVPGRGAPPSAAWQETRGPWPWKGLLFSGSDAAGVWAGDACWSLHPAPGPVASKAHLAFGV